MKVCSGCKVEKDFSEFCKHRNHKDGLSSTCKDCAREYNKKYRQNNRESIAEKKKEYQQNNKERIAEHGREYRKNNPYQIQSSRLSSSARKRAKKNKIPIDLDFISMPNMLNWLKRQPNCVCCGIRFRFGYKGKSGFHVGSPSLDRFNPSLGYIPGNVFLICVKCNTLKNDATLKELETVLAWMKKTENYLNRFNYSVEEE